MKIFIYLTLVIILMFNCSSNQSTTGEEIVLQVGKLQITAYELEKNINQFRSTFLNNTGRQPGEKELKQWLQEFIDRACILADAYQKGYDTLPAITRKVAAMEHFIVSQPYGYFEQKLAEDSLNITEADIRRAMSLYNKQVEVQYLRFRNYNSGIRMLGTSPLKNITDFENAVKKCEGQSDVLHKKELLTWPLMKWWEHETLIFSLKKGDIVPLTAFNDGYYVMLVENVTNNKLVTDSTTQRARMAEVVKSQQREKLFYRNRKQTMEQAQITYNTGLLDEICKGITPGNDIHEFGKEQYAPLLEKSIIKYRMDNRDVNVPFSYFIDYYNELPMRYTISNKEQLQSILDAMVLREFNYQKGVKLGITRQPKFILDKENYKKNNIYLLYEDAEIKKQLNITENEITERYEHNKNAYLQATNVIASVYVTHSMESAMLVMGLIRRGTSDSARFTAVKGFLSMQRHVNIGFDDKNYPDTIVSTLFDMKINQAGRPVQVKNEYYVVFKENEYGTRVRGLGEVKALIRKELEEQKARLVKDALVLKCKSGFTIKNNIETQRYTTQQ